MSEQIYSDMVRKTGKQLRLGALFRQIIQTWRENQAPCEHPWKGNLGHASKSRLKSTKNLCLGHRFFDEIRQNPPILLHYQAKVTDSLQKSGAHWMAQLPTHRTTSRLCSYRWRTARLANRNAPVGGHPGPKEIENCGNDGQNDDGGNQRACI